MPAGLVEAAVPFEVAEVVDEPACRSKPRWPVLVTATGSLPVTTALTVGDTTDTAAVGLAASVPSNASTGTGLRAITLGSLGLVSNGSVLERARASDSGRLSMGHLMVFIIP
jgi:hypothetical protein